MRRRPVFLLRLGSWLALATWVSATGCIHNHYYGTQPVCGEVLAPGPVASGVVCEVPTQVVGGVPTQTASAAAPGTTIISAPRARRVVVSEPQDGVPLVRRGGLFSSWRRSAEIDVAPTVVTGGREEDTLNR